ncbi:MAG: hypothetical protein J6Q22_10090 [Prevotella sp.]|nr:hypothetical protein [Prevotella sp.]
MSWYTESDGTIIVCPDSDQLKSHIGFQMGTILRYDGKLVLIDPDLLWMCGKKTTEKKWEQEHSPVEEDGVDLTAPYKKAVEFISIPSQRHQEGCPRDKTKCRFWNDVFDVCSIARRWKAKIEQKCPCAINEEGINNV